MDFERSPWEKFNRILTVIAVLFLSVWAWNWFGPDGSTVRQAGEIRARSSGFTLMEFFWISIAVTCAGYLLWRFLSWLFWRKYFGGSPPPDEPM